MSARPNKFMESFGAKNKSARLEVLKKQEGNRLFLEAQLKSSSNPVTPSREDQPFTPEGSEDQAATGSQRRIKSCGPRLTLGAESSNVAVKERGDLENVDMPLGISQESETFDRLGSFSAGARTSKPNLLFQFSSDSEQSFPISGQIEARMFSGTKKFITLDSLLSKKQPVSCPITSNQAKGFVWDPPSEVDEDTEEEEEEEQKPEGVVKVGLKRKESLFQLKKENVTQQRLISVDREQCHKTEQATLCHEKEPDIKRRQAVTVWRSNTWSLKDSVETSERLRCLGLKRQSSSVESSSARRVVRDRPQQPRQPMIDEGEDLEEEEEVGDERGSMSDDTEERSSSFRRRSKTISNVVKSYSILDRDFRLSSNKLAMWNRDSDGRLNNNNINRSSTGSIIEDQTFNMAEDNLVQKCVVLQRDEHGYGLSVGGDSPVYVNMVRENGAASRAGIQRGDKIIKVNGTLVTRCSHSEVNDLLRFGSYVNLTLLGRLPTTKGGQITLSRHLDDLRERKNSSSTTSTPEREADISGPKAVDPAKASQYLLQKMITMKKYQKQVQDEFERMKLEYEKSPSELLLRQMEVKKQMLNKLDDELKNMQFTDPQPRRPFSAGYEPSSVNQDDAVHTSPAMTMALTTTTATTPTTRHKKSDSMPEAFYKMTNLKRYTTLSESTNKDENEKQEEGEDQVRVHKNLDGVKGRQMTPLDTTSDQGKNSQTLPHQIEDPLIFTDLDQLKGHPAHLSVFLHYIMPNFDVSPMLFHIVTESYPQGSLKDMRKWAYEIYSTFLNEKSPLKLEVEKVIVTTLETCLQTKMDNEEALRSIFVPARLAVAGEIYDQLADFRIKKAAGADGIYSDHDLKENMDKSTELKIIENCLWKYFERLSMNRSNDRCKALSSALATFFRGVGLSGSKIGSSLERCYTFNAKDKRTFKFKTNKKLYNGHQYVAQQYYMPTYCHRCHSLFWGIGHQGFQCSHCDINLHKNCIELFREPCTGGGVKKRKEKKMSTSVFDKIISRKISVNNPVAIKEAQHIHEMSPFSSSTFVAGISTPAIQHTAAINGDNEETGKRSSSQEPRHDHERRVQDDSFEVNPDLLVAPSDTTGSSTSVNRSESLQGKLDNKVNVRRAHSMFTTEPKVKRKTAIDVTPENQPSQPQLSDSSGCSSNSSLSVKSSDLIGGGPQEGDTTANQQHQSSQLHHHSFSNFSTSQQHPSHIQNLLTHQSQPSHQSSLTYSLSSLVMQSHQRGVTAPAGTPGFASDSDFEVDPELPSIESYIPKEQLKKLKPKERKRQEVINELFHTEQAHVRNLKVMNRLFCQPMMEDSNIPNELVMLIFPNLQELIDCHSSINEEFKSKRSEDLVVGDFARILEQKFSGTEGERMKAAAATFCQNQSHSLEVLKVKQKKDAKFASFLQEAASHPFCRRLELKDLIPTEMQRLTKYPLLIENLLKYTPTNTEEYQVLLRALDCSKSVLSVVDQRVKECENQQKLMDLQRRLDSKPIENSSLPIIAEFKKLDLRRHKMVYDGPLTWRICRSKQLEMHAVLLEDILVLLQKSQDSEKLVLKCQSSNLSVASSSTPLGGGQSVVGASMGGKDDSKVTHSPIIKFTTTLLLRNVATEKKAFFLVSISEFGPQIYEFIAPTRDEKNRWFKHISDSSEAYKRKNELIEKPAPISSVPSSTSYDYLAGNNVVATGGQEAETVQPSGSVPLLSSSISSIIPDNIGHLKVAKVDPSVHHHQSRADAPSSFQLYDTLSRSKSIDSDNDDRSEIGRGAGCINDDNGATVTIVESDGGDDVCLVQPNEVKVSTFQILEKQFSMPQPNITDIVRHTNTELELALAEKKRLVAELLDIPIEEYDNIAQIAEEEAGHSHDVRELLLAMLTQTDHLVNLVSSSSNFEGSGQTPVQRDVASASNTDPAVVSSLNPSDAGVSNTMVVVSSSRILGISSKLNQLLLQLMEVLIQQEANTNQISSTEPNLETTPHPAPHSTTERPECHSDDGTEQSVAAQAEQLPTMTAVDHVFEVRPVVKKSLLTTHEATVFESPKFETAHVLTSSVDQVVCRGDQLICSGNQLQLTLRNPSLSPSSSMQTLVTFSSSPASSTTSQQNSNCRNVSSGDVVAATTIRNAANDEDNESVHPTSVLHMSSIQLPQSVTTYNDASPQLLHVDDDNINSNNNNNDDDDGDDDSSFNNVEDNFEGVTAGEEASLTVL